MQFDYSGPLLPEMVRLHGKWYPDRPAAIDEEKSLTWSELDRASNQVANGLVSLGIGKGDGVVPPLPYRTGTLDTGRPEQKAFQTLGPGNQAIGAVERAPVIR